MVCEYHGFTLHRRQCSKQGPHSAISRFTGLDRRGQRTGVADHVGISVIHNNETILTRKDRCFGGGGHLGRSHVRLQIISRHLRTGRTSAILARERRAAVVIEEKSNVRIFLRLGAAKLSDARVTHDLS